MAEQNGKPKLGFEERMFEVRMEALTMNLELTVHAMTALQVSVESHDRQLDGLIALAQSQHDRIAMLEGS